MWEELLQNEFWSIKVKVDPYLLCKFLWKCPGFWNQRNMWKTRCVYLLSSCFRKSNRKYVFKADNENTRLTLQSFVLRGLKTNKERFAFIFYSTITQKISMKKNWVFK